MSQTLPAVQYWIVNRQLLTNRPDVFSKNFDLPKSVPVDGLTRISHRIMKETTSDKTMTQKNGFQGGDHDSMP